LRLQKLKREAKLGSVRETHTQTREEAHEQEQHEDVEMSTKHLKSSRSRSCYALTMYAVMLMHGEALNDIPEDFERWLVLPCFGTRCVLKIFNGIALALSDESVRSITSPLPLRDRARRFVRVS
jgi:hypothetical protein